MPRPPGSGRPPLMRGFGFLNCEGVTILPMVDRLPGGKAKWLPPASFFVTKSRRRHILVYVIPEDPVVEACLNPSSRTSDEAERGETELVKRIQGGDRRAYRALMQIHMRPVRAYIAYQAPMVPEATMEEVAQDAFVVAFRKINEFKAGTSFRIWVRTIAWQLLRREAQKFDSERRKREKLTALGLTQHHEVEGQDVRAEYLDECLLKLKGQARDLLRLKYHDGYSTREIASRVERSGDWVRTSLYRIRNQLRQCIQSRIEQANHST